MTSPRRALTDLATLADNLRDDLHRLREAVDDYEVRNTDERDLLAVIGAAVDTIGIATAAVLDLLNDQPRATVARTTRDGAR